MSHKVKDQLNDKTCNMIKIHCIKGKIWNVESKKILMQNHKINYLWNFQRWKFHILSKTYLGKDTVKHITLENWNFCLFDQNSRGFSACSATCF